jgi:hypothetical protein
MPTPTLQAPGLYPGTGQAKLLNMNHQYFLLKEMRVLAGQASVAVQLSRMPRTPYPFGAAVQVQFSGAPGSFEVDIEGAEDDVDAMYVKLVGITTVNASNVGRGAVTTEYPKFCRVKVVSLTNDVLITAIITR